MYKIIKQTIQALTWKKNGREMQTNVETCKQYNFSYELPENMIANDVNKGKSKKEEDDAAFEKSLDDMVADEQVVEDDEQVVEDEEEDLGINEDEEEEIIVDEETEKEIEIVRTNENQRFKKPSFKKPIRII